MTATKRSVALITGINGQDGSYMSELLLEKGYTVHGILRRSSNFNTSRIDHILDRLELHYGDVSDMGNVLSIISQIRPDEIYNFAAMSHVKVSFELENYTFQVNTMGVLNILEAIRCLQLSSTKLYQASTSEMYGNTTDGSTSLTESSAMNPVSPYGISKLAAHHICNYYRDAYQMFVVSSILLNHESERRGPTFVTMKISEYVGAFQTRQEHNKKWFGRWPRTESLPKPLQLGNLDAQRDWGYAKDYVEGIWRMMQHKTPQNYVLATGETHSVREFVELAFGEIGVDIEWRNDRGSLEEYGVDSKTGRTLVQVNPKYYRPIDIETLIGDSSKARRDLGWKSSTTFQELVALMVRGSILSRQKGEHALKTHPPTLSSRRSSHPSGG